MDRAQPYIVDAVGLKGKVALMFDEDEAGWKGREEALSPTLVMRDTYTT